MTDLLDRARALETQLRKDERRARDVAPKADADRLPAIADTLRDLRAEVERLHGQTHANWTLRQQLDGLQANLTDRTRQRDAAEDTLRSVAEQRDAALARVKELEAEVAVLRARQERLRIRVEHLKHVGPCRSCGDRAQDLRDILEYQP